MSQQVTPFAVTFASGKIISLVAPPTVVIGGTTYAFSNWNVNSTYIPDNPVQITVDKPFTVVAVYVAFIKLNVNSNPELHVGVTIDGVFVGYTPVSVEVEKGSHTIAVDSEVV